MYNFHTHSTFCDGKNTPEEIVLTALDKGFLSIGFSGHGYTDFDLRYCMQDTQSYISEIRRLREKYKNEIQIYVGVEEDAFSLVDRRQFDYIIGSSHYFYSNGQYFPIDSGYDYFKRCLELFQYDSVSLAEHYYSSFCKYIMKRKPDIIGHFDLITKFDEIEESRFLKNSEYNKIAEKFIEIAARSVCVFEVNTGGISRGICKTPYPRENLLYVLRKLDAPIMISSDSHSKETIDFGFEEVKQYLRDIGFRYANTIMDGRIVKYEI